MPAEIAFAIVAALSGVSAAAAVFLRNPVHCALCLVLSFAALAAAYLQLRAEFVGLGQILVYAGAVAILIMFAILLTRSGEVESGLPILSVSWPVGVAIALGVFSCLAWAVLDAPAAGAEQAVEAPPAAPIRAIGEELLGGYVLPLEVLGLLLTAALVGAVLIAMKEADT